MSEEPTPDIPPDLDADYANSEVEDALRSLQEAPNYDRLAIFLTQLREGFLFVDVTGAPKNSKKKGLRIRTSRSTKGQLLLPLFTSMERLRGAARQGGRKQAEPKGVLAPAQEALRMIHSDRFIAAQLNPGPAELVILRKYIDAVLNDEEITAKTLEAMK